MLNHKSCHRLEKYLNMEGLGGGTLTTKMGRGSSNHLEQGQTDG